MTEYRWYHSNDVRDIQVDILDQQPKYINVCGCPLNHTMLSWGQAWQNQYIFNDTCKTKASVSYTLEEFMALNKKDTYCYPWYDEVRDLRTDMDWTKNVEVCSCPKKHTYTYNGDKSTRVPGFACGTLTSWSGSITKLLDNKIEVKSPEEIKLKVELTPFEMNLVDSIRKMAAPDKNIIAALMMTQWIRAQRMPFESDRLIELYDAPKKKGIV